MTDKNIVIGILVTAMLALAACGSANSAGKTETAAEAKTETVVEMPNPWHETTDLEEAEKATGIHTGTRRTFSRQITRGAKSS